MGSKEMTESIKGIRALKKELKTKKVPVENSKESHELVTKDSKLDSKRADNAETEIAVTSDTDEIESNSMSESVKGIRALKKELKTKKLPSQLSKDQIETKACNESQKEMSNDDTKQRNLTKEPVDDKEDVFIIEKLMEKKGKKYYVKWLNFPEDECTWEPRSSIPEHIVDFYEEDLSRLGSPA